jgi:hypothetical protein
MIFMMPIVQLMILPQVANYEIRNVNISVIDHDHSDYSRRLIGKITATDCFNLASSPASFNEALNEVEHDRSDLILEIPANFERTLVRENEAKLSISVNAINGIRANLGSAYLQSILQDFNADIRAEWFQMPKFDEITRVEVAPRNRYNPHMNYKLFMVPGILVILLTMTGANMADQCNAHTQAFVHHGQTPALLDHRIYRHHHRPMHCPFCLRHCACGQHRLTVFVRLCLFTGCIGSGFVDVDRCTIAAAGHVDFVFHHDGVHIAWRFVHQH